MPTKNDITGDEIKTKLVNESYRYNYDLIFRNKPPVFYWENEFPATKGDEGEDDENAEA